MNNGHCRQNMQLVHGAWQLNTACIGASHVCVGIRVRYGHVQRHRNEAGTLLVFDLYMMHI